MFTAQSGGGQSGNGKNRNRPERTRRWRVQAAAGRRPGGESQGGKQQCQAGWAESGLRTERDRCASGGRERFPTWEFWNRQAGRLGGPLVVCVLICGSRVRVLAILPLVRGLPLLLLLSHPGEAEGGARACRPGAPTRGRPTLSPQPQRYLLSSSSVSPESSAPLSCPSGSGSSVSTGVCLVS